MESSPLRRLQPLLLQPGKEGGVSGPGHPVQRLRVPWKADRPRDGLRVVFGADRSLAGQPDAVPATATAGF
jgi:hypothetical protein